jgi:hypothetical protein
MTVMQTSGPATPSSGDRVVEAGDTDDIAAADADLLSDRAIGRLALGLTLVPVVVGVLALIFAVGNQYHPSSDHALIEMQTRSVGRNDVLVGLFSRDTWNHPGPAQFYVLAPFYWLTGGMSVGISIGALVVNGASVAGMALVARRLGGTPLLLVTLLANALLMRSLSGEFLQDPWNCFMTTLPFGLLVFLSWAMWRGEMWAFPVGAGVFTFLAQAHVGFIALASPLLAWGAVGLVASVVTSQRTEPAEGTRWLTWRALVRTGVIGSVVLVVGWLPVAIDTLRNSPSNTREVVDYFRHPDESAHTLVDGWRVVVGQFGGAPEWLTYKHAPTYAGQSPFIASDVIPWMLLLLAGAGIVLWRRRVAGSVALLATIAVAFVVGVVAVSRTIGPAFDYRLRWTYIPAMVAMVVIGWAGWTLVAARWPRAGARVLTPVALAALAVLGGINSYTAATAGTPQNDDSASVASLTDQVLDHLAGDEGAVLVNDQLHSGAWHARGLVLQLEREGYEVGVHESLANEYGRHRVLPEPDADDDPVIVLHVSRDQYLPNVAARPGMRPIAEWYARPEAEVEELLALSAAIDEDIETGRISSDEGMRQQLEVNAELTNGGKSTAYHVVVFVEERSVAAPPAAAPSG